MENVSYEFETWMRGNDYFKNVSQNDHFDFRAVKLHVSNQYNIFISSKRNVQIEV